MSRVITVTIDGSSIKVDDSEHPTLDISFEKNRAVDELIASVERAVINSKTEGE